MVRIAHSGGEDGLLTFVLSEPPSASTRRRLSHESPEFDRLIHIFRVAGQRTGIMVAKDVDCIIAKRSSRMIFRTFGPRRRDIRLQPPHARDFVRRPRPE